MITQQMVTQPIDSDMIALHSVESYLKSNNIPMAQSPQEQIMMTQSARDYLYSEIVRRVPRIAAYILQADMETDTRAQGLNMSLSKHVMDPVFVSMLMEYLYQNNNAVDNCNTGAYLAKILNKWLDQNIKAPEKIMVPPKEGEKEGFVENVNKPTQNDIAPVEHIRAAVSKLLGNIQAIVMSRCGNVTEGQALAIAACISMNNKETIKELISSDFPVTADILDIVADPRNFMQAALLFEKTDIPAKLTTNQTAFVDSLKRWVYKKLNDKPTQWSYQFMVATYGSATGVDVSTKFINPKDCGTQYSNLLTVAKQLINK